MAKKKKELINLLPQEEFASSTLGRVLAWLLSTFRMIVIVTEMVVMAAFLSRFWLDARNTDLNDLINQKRLIIESYGNVEKTFRSTQSKLSVFATLTKDDTLNSIIQNITASIPSGIILNSIAFSGSELTIKGTTISESSVAQFIVNLGAQKKFGDIALSQIDSDKNGNGLVFTLKTNLGTGGKK